MVRNINTILPPCESRINARKTKSLQELILSFSKNVGIFYWPFLSKKSLFRFNQKVWWISESWSWRKLFTLITVFKNDNYRCAQLQGSGQTPAPSLGHRFEPPRFRSRGQRPIIATSSSREGGENFYVCPPHCVSTNVGCVGNVV